MRYCLTLFLSFFVLVNICYPNSVDSTKTSQDTIKNITFAGIPMINYNRTFGLIVGGMGAMYYKLNRQDTISPSSATMLIGVYTTSKTYFALAVQQLYMREDNWRSTIVGGYGDVFFQYYQNLPGIGQSKIDGIWIDFNTSITFLHAKVQRQVLKNFYIGLETTLSDAKTVFDIENPITGEKITTEAKMNMLGYNLLYDNRSDVNFPMKGYFIQLSNNFVREAFGSSNNFESYEISFNNFWDIKKKHKSILVSRVYADIASGDVPFQGENVIGGDDLRGYTQGKYRGKQVYAIQAELRQNVYKKFGMVGFFGVGTAVESVSDIPDADFLPSVGLGLRYLMIEKEKINVGIDAGLGKDDWSLTFRIGETFGR